MKRWLWLMMVMGAASMPVAPSAGATVSIEPAQNLSFFAYHEQPGSQVSMLRRFQSDKGSEVVLGKLAQGRPLILIPAYFHCVNLCGVVRASLFEALRPTRLEAGRDYALAVLSVDPTETSDDARSAKARDIEAFGLPGAEQHWHYLTGSMQDIQAVLDAVGFRDRLDQHTKQYLHPAGLIFLTPDGTVSSYLLGVGYTPVQIRSALERAAAGRIAAIGSPLLLLCFHFDASTGRYTLQIIKVIRLAAFVTLITLIAVLLLLRRRERAA
jgi:protein SCO1/2